MPDPQQELIWRGRLHLGDEPGVYGDACYAGLAIDLPVTIRPLPDPPDPDGDDRLTFTLRADAVAVFPGYPGHRIAVVRYEEAGAPARWHERVLVEERMDAAVKTVVVPLGGIAPSAEAPLYTSVRVRLDTEVAPGFYDDFVLLSLSLRPERYYASFGFHR